MSSNIDFWQRLYTIVKKEREEEPVFFNVGEMGASRKAKVRYVSGWSIKKLLSKARKYVTCNMFCASRETLIIVCEENLVVLYA